MQKKVIIIGPAHPLRGGLATFNQRLCKQFVEEGHDCCIFSFSLQYPSFLFPGTTQYSKEPAPKDIRIYSVINSMHPLNWWQVGQEIRRMKPDILVVRYWLPFMGPALGTILRQVRKNKHTRIIAIADNIIPHEKRWGDTAFTKYFLKSCDAFITMSEKVMNDLRQFEKEKPALQVMHPLYDNFGEPVSKEEARKKLGIGMDQSIILFFGFIRKYKGLDILLDAMKELRETNSKFLKLRLTDRIQMISSEEQENPKSDPDSYRDGNLKLLIAGEFYEIEKPYREQIERLGIKDMLILRTGFIPDSEVKNYLCAADVVVQPYRNATQSGVTPLAYHFEKPMIVTNVGSLPNLVPHKKVGLVCEPDAASIADAIRHYFQLGENYFLPHLRIEKEKYSWSKLVSAIIELADSKMHARP